MGYMLSGDFRIQYTALCDNNIIIIYVYIHDKYTLLELHWLKIWIVTITFIVIAFKKHLAIPYLDDTQVTIQLCSF